MNNKKLQQYILLGIISLVIIFTFFILKPFLYVVVLATVCAIIFQPIHKKILHFLNNKKWLAALFTTIFIVVTILVPVVFLGINIFQEAREFYLFLISESGKDSLVSIAKSLNGNFQKYIPIDQAFVIDTSKYIEQGLLWTLDNMRAIFGSALVLLLNFIIFIIITYYIVKDGPELKKILVKFSPLKDEDNDLVYKKIKIATNSVVKGSLVVALIQGAMVAIGFYIFGVPNVVLWGVVSTVAALIPSIGTSIILIPAIILIFLRGEVILAVGLLAWGIIVINPIDGLLRPILIGKGVNIHPLIIFLSVIGGIVFLGPIGFLIGPLTISLLFALLDVYTHLKDEKLD
jgi:predicted PurR-regulated permease PerM